MPLFAIANCFEEANDDLKPMKSVGLKNCARTNPNSSMLEFYTFCDEIRDHDSECRK